MIDIQSSPVGSPRAVENPAPKPHEAPKPALRRKKSRRYIFIGLILLLVAGGIAAKFFYRKTDIPVIQSEKAARRNITEVVLANGRVQPVVQVVITPEVSGEIIALPVKEGQHVEKGDLLVRIKPDSYEASRKSAEATYQSSIASLSLAKANLDKAEIELNRNKGLFESSLISDSAFLESKTSFEIARAQHKSAQHQVDVAMASLSRAQEDLAKTTIVAPMAGTVTRLKSESGERVLGTGYSAGTEIMTVANLNEMEARVDIGEIDIVLIKVGQVARLEVDAFRDRKFSGVVTEIANASKTSGGTGMGQSSSQQSQDATRFEVKIHLKEKEPFRPGMSVTAEIETRYRTNVISVPIQSVTTRLPSTNSPVAAGIPADKPIRREDASTTNGMKRAEGPKQMEVVFAVDADHVRMVPVKRGISNEDFVEIVEGVKEGDEIVSGGYKAISRDLEDGKKIKKGGPEKSLSGEKKS